MSKMTFFLVLLGFLEISSCKSIASNSEEKYDPTIFDCSELRNSSLMSECKNVESLKKENSPKLKRLLGDDLYSYNKAYYSSFSKNSQPMTLKISDAIKQIPLDVSVVFSGDVHGDKDYGKSHVILLKELASFFGADKIGCATEMVFESEHNIAKFGKGEINSEEMKEVVKQYSALEWPEWFAYFELCRTYGMPFSPVDVPQTDGQSSRDRDEGIKNQLISKLNSGKRKILFLPIGSLHLAGTNKLPELLRDAGIITYQFLGLATASFHWRCAQNLGSEEKMQAHVCAKDRYSAYLFPKQSLYEFLAVLYGRLGGRDTGNSPE